MPGTGATPEEEEDEEKWAWLVEPLHILDFTFLLTTATSRLHPTPQYVQTVRIFSSTTIDLDSNTSDIADVGQACAHAPQLTQSDSKKD